jgi:hypothetical protein
MKDEIKEFKDAFMQFDAECRKKGYCPNARIIYRPEVRETTSVREQRLVDYVVDTYLTINISPLSLKKDENARQEKGNIHKKDTGKNKKSS